MQTKYTVLRVWLKTLRKLKIAAAHQPKNMSIIALVDRFVDDELKRLDLEDVINEKENPHG
jgi:hypothetical protein